MTPLVSIIIPVHNTEQYLKQCLNSVINQTFKDIEIIIINGCSTDNSYNIINEFKLQDNRIIIINLETDIGIGVVRNKGLKIARGKYISFIDSDDWVKPNYIEFLYNTIKKYNVDFVSAGHTIYDNNTSAFSENKNPMIFLKQHTFYDFIINDEDIKKQLLLDPPSIYVWSKIYKRDFLLSNNIYFKTKFFEDNLFTWEVIANAKNFLFVKDSIYYYRTNRKGSFVYIYKNKFAIYNSILFENLRNCLISNKTYEKYKKEFFTYISLRTLDCMEYSTFSHSRLTAIFLKFRKNFYTKDFVLSYKILNFETATKLFSFQLCLKYNVDYILFVKFYKAYERIKSIISSLIRFKFK